jgi:hypothetical protein
MFLDALKVKNHNKYEEGQSVAFSNLFGLIVLFEGRYQDAKKCESKNFV